jgi:dipeptide transport system substrate-binding protein
MKNSIKVAIAISGIALALAFTACTKKKEGAGGTGGSGKTFVYCSEGSPSTFNPQLGTDGPTFNASSHTIYSGLVDFKTGTTEIEPALAESWTISKDGLTYTFVLRKGVKFHTSETYTPTRDFNADDVLFSFNRMRMKDHPYHLIGGGNYEYFTSMEMGKTIKDIRKTDDYTVTFQLSQKDAPFLANLAMDFASILSAEYGDKMQAAGTLEKVDTEPVGTGPFVFQRYQKDTMIRYKAHEQYFRGRPKLDTLVFSITPDPSVRTQKLKARECHLIAEPSPQDLDSLKATPTVEVLDKEGLNVGYLAMNTEKAPFNKKEVRQAINLALNKASYMDAIYLGRATIAKNPIPPTIWSYNDDVKDYDFDIEKAKELLKKAGLASGFETELWTLPVSRPYNPFGKKMGELMQADLAKIGIKVKLVTYDWPTYLDKSSKGEHQMLQLGWTGDNGDPDNFMNVLLGCSGVKGGSNVARWCHKPFNDLVQKAKQVTDLPERTKLYKQAQVVFKEEAPWVTLAHARVFRALDKSVKGYVIHPFGSELFATVDLENLK